MITLFDWRFKYGAALLVAQATDWIVNLMDVVVFEVPAVGVVTE